MKKCFSFVTKLKPDVVILYISLICIFFLCLVMHQPGHNWGGDFALYINQAKSITDGTIQQVIDNNQFSIANSTIHTFSPVLAPWGWPIILSPFYAIFGLNIGVFKIIISALFVLFLFVFYRLIRSNIGSSIALLSILYLGTNFRYIDYTNTMLTEIPYLFFATLSLLLIQQYQLKCFKWGKAVLLGIILYFTFIVRSEGILL